MSALFSQLVLELARAYKPYKSYKSYKNQKERPEAVAVFGVPAVWGGGVGYLTLTFVTLSAMTTMYVPGVRSRPPTRRPSML